MAYVSPRDKPEHAKAFDLMDQAHGLMLRSGIHHSDDEYCLRVRRDIFDLLCDVMNDSDGDGPADGIMTFRGLPIVSDASLIAAYQFERIKAPPVPARVPSSDRRR